MVGKRQTEEKLHELLDILSDYFKQKLADGNLSANEQKNLIQLLRDNNITIEPNSGTPLDDIVDGNFEGLEDSVEQYHQ